MPRKTLMTPAERVWQCGAIAIACLVLLPLGAIFWISLSPTGDVWTHLIGTVLPRSFRTTVILMAGVGLATTCMGIGTAWLTTMCRFPGQKHFDWALLVPLAVPTYIVAFAYVEVLDYTGPVQSLLRATFDFKTSRDYWFPEIRSLGGAAMMLVLVLYPYVYLLARAAFLQQSGTTFLAARALGSSVWGAFFKVSLPLARPAIAAGVLLTVMETIADFGTVSYFGVQTFATGIYTSWFSMGDRAGAAQLALCLLCLALVLAVIERSTRGKARYHQAGKQHAPMPPADLKGGQAFFAWILCALPVCFGFLLPLIILFNMGLQSEQNLFSSRYIGFLQNSLLLATLAALLTVMAAICLGFYQRLRPGRSSALAAYMSRLGYAVPGGVIAVGLLVPFAAFDNALDAWMRARFDISTGLLITGLRIWRTLRPCLK